MIEGGDRENKRKGVEKRRKEQMGMRGERERDINIERDKKA